MNDSYFLTSDKDKKSFYFSQYGCCEYAGDSLKKMNSVIYEFISINEIRNDYLKNKNIIEEYAYLISEFIGIELTRVALPEKDTIDHLPSSIKNLSKEEYEETFICFEVGKYLSNKHFVAMHTLLRYLWYDVYYHDIVNTVLNIRKYVIDLPIEDVFAIAHSFQDKNSRALTGKTNMKNFGFMYFRPQKEFLPELKRNVQFNAIFDDFNMSLVPKITLKGNFFDDSEVVLESKSFISFLTSDGNQTDGLSEKMLRQALSVYTSYKDLFMEARRVFEEKSKKYRIYKLEVRSNNDILEGITFDAVNSVDGASISKNLTSEKALYNLLKELK